MSIPTSTSDPTEPRAVADRVPTWLLAILGIALTALAGNRGGIAVLGWIAPIPLLLMATRARRWHGWLLLYLVCVAAITLLTLKIISAPMNPLFALIFAIPGGLILWLSLLLWNAIRRRLGPIWGIYAFVALSVLADTVMFRLTPMGDWPATANTQVENLPLLQVASLGGLGLITAVMTWPIGAAAMLLSAPARRRLWPHAIAGVAVVFAAYAWGSLRLDSLNLGPTLRVAGVTVDMPRDMTSMAQLRGSEETLFSRSELAARRGAQLIVWNEVATLVNPDEEPPLRARGIELAKRYGVDLVLAYGVVRSDEPLLVENKYEWLGPNGETVDVYRKHFLPPTEASIAGREPLRVVERPWGKAAGAICYDYDSPALARRHALGGAGVIALPSSDWRGIDPQHPYMARVRAIEGGMSIVRPARSATSMVFDPYGRVRASMSAWEENERVILATVPTRQVHTLYTLLGDWPAYLAAFVALAAVVAAFRPGLRIPSVPTPSPVPPSRAGGSSTPGEA